VVWFLEGLLEAQSDMAQLAELFLCVAAGFIVYGGALYVVRVSEIRNLSALLPKRATDVTSTL
jgi:hypothetical protein